VERRFYYPDGTVPIAERSLKRAQDSGWYRPNSLNGLCHCGCGERTAVATCTSRRSGAIQGMPRQFMTGHNFKKEGKAQPNCRGYVHVWVPADHPSACMRSKSGQIAEHRLVMSEHLGRPLAQDEHVHHINNIKHDNRIENLELVDNAQNMAYRTQRQRLAERVLRALESVEMDPEQWLAQFEEGSVASDRLTP
jgi:HNH endonuclease